MKLATFLLSGLSRPGVVIGEGAAQRILDLQAAAARGGADEPAFASMLALIQAGPRGLDTAQQMLTRYGNDPDLCRPLTTARLLAPLPEPPQMRDFSVFPEHIRNAPAGMQRIAARKAGDVAAADAIEPLPDVPPVYRERPIYYITNRFSVAGPDADVHWPSYSRLMDFELELGMILAKGGRNIALERAREHVFGYTVYNDFSARDTQYEEMQGMLGPAKGKSFDGSNVLGPWIVTADEIPDPYALAMRARVNGETWTNSSSAGMLHSFEEMIAYVSRDETLHAGEFFGSGTVGGGCGLELDRWLNHGDCIELEIEGIGVLRNRVIVQEWQSPRATSPEAGLR